MHYLGRGRLWLAAAAFCVFLLQAAAIGRRARLAGAGPARLARFAWQTQQKLRLEQTAGDSVGGPFGTRSSAL
jgi:hypothetical protein